MTLDPAVLTDYRNVTSRNENELSDATIEWAHTREENTINGVLDKNAVIADIWLHLATNVKWGSRGIGNLSISRPLAWSMYQFWYGKSILGNGVSIAPGLLMRTDRGILVAPTTEDEHGA